jgi:hypothetical protein
MNAGDTAWVLLSAGLGQPRLVEFEPRLRLEVSAAGSDVPRVVQAIKRIAGAGAYLQVIDSHLPKAVGGSPTPRT